MIEFEKLAKMARSADLTLDQMDKGLPGNVALRYLLERDDCKAVVFMDQPFFYDSAVIDKDEAVRLLYLAFFGPKRMDYTPQFISARAQSYLYQVCKQRVEEIEWKLDAPRYDESGFCQRLTDYFFDCCEREERIYGSVMGTVPLTEHEFNPNSKMGDTTDV